MSPGTGCQEDSVFMFPGQSLIKCDLIISIFTRLHRTGPERLRAQVSSVSAQAGQLPVPHRFLIVNSIIPANS